MHPPQASCLLGTGCFGGLISHRLESSEFHASAAGFGYGVSGLMAGTPFWGSGRPSPGHDLLLRQPELCFPMATKPQSAWSVGQSELTPPFRRSCRSVALWSRVDLLSVAIARGCAHYAPLWPEITPCDDPELPHEILGCALLRGPTDADTFQMIRCGAMVLCDLGNLPARIAYAAKVMGVAGRVLHIARLGLAEDTYPEYWTKIRKLLPDLPTVEQDFLPGVSRLAVETKLSGPGKGPERVWLRTAYSRTVR